MIFGDRWSRAACGLVVMGLLGAMAGTAHAGDKDLATFLMKGGKKAIYSRDYDDGISRLEKALVEDPELYEAHYWIALGQDKLKNLPAALVSYRAFREACDAQADLPRSLSSLLRKTSSRLRVLAAGETELTKLNDRFAKDAVKLAEKCFLRDPELARRAAEAATIVAPKHKDALKLLAKLGGGKRKGEGPTGDVEEWDDFLERSLFGSNDGWSFANDTLTILHESGGSFITPKRAFQSPKNYVYEIEGQFLEIFAEPGLGISFAKIGSEWITCHFNNAEVVLWKSDGATHKQENLVRHPMDPLKKNTWYRLSLAVKENHVEVFWNGKKLFEKKVSGVDDLAGDVGLFYQASKVEIRVLRMGERK